MNITIEKKPIGDNQPVFIIAEAGVNHNGSLNLAKKLVDAAAAAGADAVKFQTFTAEALVSPHAPKAAYQEGKTFGASQFEMLKQLELSADAFQSLKQHCDQQNIIFLSTPFDTGSADLLNDLHVPAFKIGSGEITNLQLIQHIAHFHKPIILSTGMATMKEITLAVDTIHKTKNTQLILLHCTTNYPADYATINLNAIPTLHRAFNVPIGYSDHTIGAEVSIAAVAMGACVIEKHFTLDKTMEGPDHAASIEPQELAAMVTAIRHIEQAKGDGVKKPFAAELEISKVARKSIFAQCAIPQGTVITADMLTIRRPEIGIKPEHFNQVVGKTTTKALAKDEPLQWDHFDEK